MRKKYIAIIAGLFMFVFTVFSLTNALALNGDDSSNGALTATKKLCEQAKKDYKQEVEAAKAKGLSLQLPKEEVDLMVRQIKDYRKRVCDEAKGKGLTSSVQLCKEAKKNYKAEISAIKAKGLSQGFSKEEIKQLIKQVKEHRATVCKGAKKEK